MLMAWPGLAIIAPIVRSLLLVLDSKLEANYELGKEYKDDNV